MAERPIRVLLVDDDEDYYILTRDLLSEIENERYELDWRPTYAAGLETIRQEPYDVCLVDFHLGGMSGLELMQTAQEQGCKAPMILLTGQGDYEVDLGAMRAGAADYLAKGQINAALLERSIRYAVERAHTVEALRQSKEQIAALYAAEQARRQELEQAYAALRQAEQRRDDMTHMIIHDLRTPLAVIMTSLHLIGKAGNMPDPADGLQRFVAGALAGSRQITWMIDDLLDVGKLEAGELRPVLDRVHLPALLASKADEYHLQAERESKVFSLRAPADTPPVLADAGLIGRVIDNLVSNAFKYTRPGGHVDVAVDSQATMVRVSVSDDGEGIPPEYQQRIFDKYVQVPGAPGAPLRKGSGLGLAFCRLAVAAHKGEIWVESVPQRSSVFTFTLPLFQ
jgi:signal transduction histidine kinase